jgi:hypothetical protein
MPLAYEFVAGVFKTGDNAGVIETGSPICIRAAVRKLNGSRNKAVRDPSIPRIGLRTAKNTY